MIYNHAGTVVTCSFTEITSPSMADQNDGVSPITLDRNHDESHTVTIANLEAKVMPGNYEWRLTCTESRFGLSAQIDPTIIEVLACD